MENIRTTPALIKKGKKRWFSLDTMHLLKAVLASTASVPVTNLSQIPWNEVYASTRWSYTNERSLHECELKFNKVRMAWMSGKSPMTKNFIKFLYESNLFGAGAFVLQPKKRPWVTVKNNLPLITADFKCNDPDTLLSTTETMSRRIPIATTQNNQSVAIEETATNGPYTLLSATEILALKTKLYAQYSYNGTRPWKTL